MQRQPMGPAQVRAAQPCRPHGSTLLEPRTLLEPTRASNSLFPTMSPAPTSKVVGSSACSLLSSSCSGDTAGQGRRVGPGQGGSGSARQRAVRHYPVAPSSKCNPAHPTHPQPRTSPSSFKHFQFRVTMSPGPATIGAAPVGAGAQGGPERRRWQQADASSARWQGGRLSAGCPLPIPPHLQPPQHAASMRCRRCCCCCCSRQTAAGGGRGNAATARRWRRRQAPLCSGCRWLLGHVLPLAAR